MGVNHLNEQVKEHMKEHVRRRYAAAAKAVESAGCCGSSTPGIGGELYSNNDRQGLPTEAVQASLGCGVPTAMVDLVPGETVLDLGSGGGIDVLLSAKRVGPTGKVYGLDMTDEMLAMARQNQAKAGATNVEFLKGEIEAIPLPDASVDLIISNCVINLSADKGKVFREAFRVLKPGGRFAVSDMAFQGDLSAIPTWLRRSIDAWCECVSGALEEREYLAGLREAGFIGESLEVTQVYAGRLADEAGQSCCGGDAVASLSGLCCGSTGKVDSGKADSEKVDSEKAGQNCCGGGTILPAGVRLVSGFVRARKPGEGPFTIREATAADVPAVSRLLKESALAEAAFQAQFGPQYKVATAADGRVIGVAGVEVYGDDGLLRSVATDAAWRGRGIGDALVRDRLAWASGRGLKSVWLLTQTAADYFPRFGFSRAERATAPAALQESEEFAYACPQSAVAMKI